MDVRNKIKILKTAELLFSKKGYDGTTVRDIATAAEVNIALINYYYRSKDQLFIEILMRLLTRIELFLDTVSTSTIDVERKLNYFVAGSALIFSVSCPDALLMLRHQTVKGNNKIEKKIAEIRNKHFDYFKEYTQFQGGSAKQAELIKVHYFIFLNILRNSNEYAEEHLEINNSFRRCVITHFFKMLLTVKDL